MVLLYSEMIPLGSKAHDFSLKGIDNKFYTLDSFKLSKILVIIFMCNHCPYVHAIWDRLIQLQNIYKDKGVQLIAINTNGANVHYPDDSFENMQKVSLERGQNFPYLFDLDQTVSKMYKAVCTPDIFVYDRDRVLAYRGRLDDNWQNPDLVKHNDLKNALNSILVDLVFTDTQFPSQGCSIKWL